MTQNIVTTQVSANNEQNMLEPNSIESNKNYLTKRFMQALPLFFAGSFAPNVDKFSSYKNYLPLYFGVGSGQLDVNNIPQNTFKAQRAVDMGTLHSEINIGGRVSCNVAEYGYAIDDTQGPYSYITIYAYISYSMLPDIKKITEMGIFTSSQCNSSNMLLYRWLGEDGDTFGPGETKQYSFTIKFKH